MQEAGQGLRSLQPRASLARRAPLAALSAKKRVDAASRERRDRVRGGMWAAWARSTMMSLRHSCSMLLLTAWLDVGVHCSSDPPRPVSRSPAVAALAASAQAVYGMAQRGPLLAAAPASQARAAESSRLWQLHSRLDEVAEAAASPLTCAADGGLLSQDASALRAVALAALSLLEDQELRLAGAAPEEPTSEALVGFDGEMLIQVQQLVDEAQRLVDEASARGCSL